MTRSHRAPGRAFAPAGSSGLLRVALAVGLGIALFGGAAYGGSRLLAGESAGSGRPAAAAGPPPAAAPDGPDSPDAVEPTPSSTPSSAAAAAPSPSLEAATRKAAPTKSRTAPPPVAAAGPTAEVLRLVNVERAKAGCGALTSDSRLVAAANAHSADMANNNYFSHTGRNGSDVADRVEAAGYRWSAIAENIAKGQQTPAAVMTAWMNSSGHRTNILNCRYRNIGIGLATRGGQPYWTQDFGTPA